MRRGGSVISVAMRVLLPDVGDLRLCDGWSIEAVALDLSAGRLGPDHRKRPRRDPGFPEALASGEAARRFSRWVAFGAPPDHASHAGSRAEPDSGRSGEDCQPVETNYEHILRGWCLTPVCVAWPQSS
jgi:hypothetical protein